MNNGFGQGTFDVMTGLSLPFAAVNNTVWQDPAFLIISNTSADWNGNVADAIEGDGGPGTSSRSGGTGIRGIGGDSGGLRGGGQLNWQQDGGGAGVLGAGGAPSGVGDTGGPGGVFVGGSPFGTSGGSSYGGDGIDVFAGKGPSGQGTALFASTENDGNAGVFDGNVSVWGSLSKSSGSFQIDHPLDPANKYLFHSFVESPDMMNVYNGTTVTDGRGTAWVALPDWFEALNRDFRYQLTVIGQFAQAIIATEIANHSFAIKTDKPNVKVSWQVTGIRQDAWANAHRIQVEVDKATADQGRYIHPELFRP